MTASTEIPADCGKKPIALVGLMGVGKSTIGRRLAQRLHIPFVDADVEIVAAASMTIPEIFEKFGEAHFRDGERRVISRLVDGRRRVIATGGGAFMNDETRALMLEHAIVVWLDADLETLVERVSRRNDRPLLAGGDTRAIMERLAAERNPVYGLAHVHVHSDRSPHEATVDRILEALA